MQKILIFFLVILFPFVSFSQYWEVGLFGGTSFYQGDLTPQIIDFNEIHHAEGAIVRYNVNQWFTVKGNAYYGEVSGNDANAKAYDTKVRNLSFKSTLLDIGVQSEINIRGFQAGHPRYNNTPYLFFGLSIFRFNPKSEYNGTWYELQPMGTEGQGTTKYNDREKYALTQVSIPMGFGWKYALNRYWNVGMEFGTRSTFTDYLDDVSKTYVEDDVLRSNHGEIAVVLANRSGEYLDEYESFTSEDNRGNPTKLDWYYFTGITISYNILPNACYRF